MNLAIPQDMPPAQPAKGHTVEARTDDRLPDGDNPDAFSGVLSLIEGISPRLPDGADLDDGGAIASGIAEMPLDHRPPHSTAVSDLASLVAGATASRVSAVTGVAAGWPDHDPALSNEVKPAPTATSAPALTGSAALNLNDFIPDARTAAREDIPIFPDAIGGTQTWPTDAPAEILGAVVTKVERQTHHILTPPSFGFTNENAVGKTVSSPVPTVTASAPVMPELSRPAETPPPAQNPGILRDPPQTASSHAHTLPPDAAGDDAQHSAAAPDTAAARVSAVRAPFEKIAEPASATAPDPAQTTAPSTLTLPQAGPARQIADVIIAAAREPAVAAALPGSTPPVTGTASPTPAPAQILTVRLEPADLGTVTVKLTLRGGRLDVAIEATDQRTTQLLRTDGEVLSKLLNGAGYGLDALAILTTAADRGASSVSPSAQTGSYLSGSEGHAPSDNHHQHQRSQQQEPQEKRTSPASQVDPARNTSDPGSSPGRGEPRAGAVYL